MALSNSSTYTSATYNPADFQGIDSEEYNDLIYQNKFLLRKINGTYQPTSPKDTAYSTDLKCYELNKLTDLVEGQSYRLVATMEPDPVSKSCNAYQHKKKVIWLILALQYGKLLRMSATPLMAYFLYDDDVRYSFVAENPFPFKMYITMMKLDSNIPHDNVNHRDIQISPNPIEISTE